MKKEAMYVLAIVIVGAILFSGCVAKTPSQDGASNANGMYQVKPGVKDTTLVTIDSLPAGASVWLEDKSISEDAKRIGVAPMQIELPKNKEYTIWLQMTLIEYRALTRNIPEIQKHLDTFERDEKYGVLTPGEDSFFEIYSQNHERYETVTDPPTLFAVRIPHEVSTLYELGDQIRVAGIFVPAGMNSDALLPLAGDKTIYEYSKEGYMNAMRRNNAPVNLAERAFPLLTRAGVTLVVFPMETVAGEPPQEMVIRIVAPSPDNSNGLAEWAIRTRTKIG